MVPIVLDRLGAGHILPFQNFHPRQTFRGISSSFGNLSALVGVPGSQASEGSAAKGEARS